MQSYTAIECNYTRGPRKVFPVKKEEQEKEEEEEEAEDGNKQHEENKIRTTMWSSVAMQQSCTGGPRQCFLSSEQGGKRGGG